jgi:hypothetical protein
LSKPVTYSEEQVRRWLGFLARNMQEHGQSMFLVEQLQPNWLRTRQQVFAYLLLSRTVIYGGLADLFFTLANWFFSDDSGLVESFKICSAITGVVTFAIVALCALFAFLRTSERVPARLRKFARAVSLPFEIAFRWMPAHWVLRRVGRTLNDDIQPVERISWTWSGFWKGFAFLRGRSLRWDSRPRLKSFLTIFFWIIRVLWLAFAARETFLLWWGRPPGADALYFSLEATFALWLPSLITGFFSAVKSADMDLKATPNLGIRLSGRNALIIGGIALLVLAAARTIAFWVHSEKEVAYAIASDLLAVISIFIGVPAGARFGAVDFVAHYCLRLLLRVFGYAPLNYVRFLDYAAGELGFLQKAGGGYVFMHRYLLEYFASSEETSGPVNAAPEQLHAT